MPPPLQLTLPRGPYAALAVTLAAGLLAGAGPAANRATAAGEGARTSAPDRNLVANGSFERSLSGWSSWRATRSRTWTAAAPDGRRAARIDARAEGSSYTFAAAPRLASHTIAGDRYTASGYVRAASRSAVGTGVILRLRERRPDGEVVAGWRSTATLTRRFRKIQVTTGPVRGRTSLQLRFGQADPRRTDAIHVDHVRLVREPSRPRPVEPPVASPSPAPAPVPPSPLPTPPSAPIPTPTETGPPVAGGYFRLLAVGAPLPAEQECTARVRRSSWEPRPANRDANQRMPGSLALPVNPDYDAEWNLRYRPRITGAFTGTTDEIIQWAACKWGLSDEMLRAQAVIESNWLQSAEGDLESRSRGHCTPGDTRDPCPVSFGLLQNKWYYNAGAYPMLRTMTSFHMDWSAAKLRGCYDGRSWFPGGDIWGCLGAWYSGTWNDSAGDAYTARVRGSMDAKPWLGW